MKYFHLISDEEIERLAPVLRLLQANRAALLDRWYELYTLHFGPDRTFGRREFDRYCGDDLDAVLSWLLDRDVVALAKHVQAIGEQLVARGVPFDEVIASMHLFEESAATFFRRNFAILARGLDVLLTFDKLSHVRMILLAGAYFRANEAKQSARVQAQERDLDRLDPDNERRKVFHGIVGESPAMRRLYARVRAAAQGRASILVAGESGTGKELVARAVHECGAGAKGPFIAVNCAALPKDL